MSDIVEDFKRYLSGWFDGDGCIMIEKQNNDGFSLRIKLSQSDENWINTIHKFYPFLNKSMGKRKEKERYEFELRAAGKKIEPLIDDLLKYSILKYEQLVEAKSYISLINTVNQTAKKLQIYNKLKELKENRNQQPLYDRLNIQYIAGLFDAEGSIGIYNNKVRVKITQKSDIVLLEHIGKLYNNTTKINNYAICFYDSNCIPFLNDMQKYCIYKIPQINACIQYLNLKTVDKSNETIELMNKYVQILKDEKHINVINESHIENTKNNIFVKNINAILETNEKELEMIKISDSIHSKKNKINLIQQKINKLPYDILIEIIDYKSKNKTSEQVSTILKEKYTIYLNRNIVSRIWNGDETLVIPENIKNTDNYKQMLENKKRRTYNNSKFT
jgi:hypothetical protein